MALKSLCRLHDVLGDGDQLTPRDAMVLEIHAVALKMLSQALQRFRERICTLLTWPGLLAVFIIPVNVQNSEANSMFSHTKTHKCLPGCSVRVTTVVSMRRNLHDLAGHL